MIFEMLVSAVKAICEPVHYNKSGALLGMVAGALLGVGGAAVLYFFGKPGPNASLGGLCVFMGSLFGVVGAVVVAQRTYHSSGTGDPRVIDIPPRSRQDGSGKSR